MLHPIARGMQQGQTVLRRPRTAAGRWSRASLSWAAQIGGIYAALAAADIHATIGTAGLVFLVSTLVQLFPFWPGNIGLFQAAVAQVLVQAYPIDFTHAHRVRGRAAGDRGLPRRRPRLLVPLARGPLAGRGARPARRRLTVAAGAFAGLRVRPRAYGASRRHVPPRGGACAHSRVDMQAMGTVLLDLAASGRGAHSRSRCRARRGALPAEAAGRPPGPTQAAPVQRAVVRTAQVPFRWHKAKQRPGYDLRVARDRALPLAHADAARARREGPAAARCPGAGSGRCAPPARSTRAGRTSRRSSCAPRGDAYPPTRPDRPARDRGRREQHHRHVRRVARTIAASCATSCWRGGKVIARGAAAPLTAQGLRLRDAVRAARARLRRRRPRLRRSRPSRTPARGPAPTTPRRTRRATCARSRSPTRASRWPGIAAQRPRRQRPPLRRLPQRRAARACPTARASWPRNLAPATPYRFTVAAIDGGGHRSPDSALDTTTQAPLPATGPAYAYMLATTGASFEDMQRHYRQIAVVSPTYYHLGPDLSIPGQDDPLVTGWARLRGIDVEPRVEIAGSGDPAHAARERRQPHRPRRRASPLSWPSTATTASTSTSRPAPPPTARCSRPS